MLEQDRRAGQVARLRFGDAGLKKRLRQSCAGLVIVRIEVEDLLETMHGFERRFGDAGQAEPTRLVMGIQFHDLPKQLPRQRGIAGLDRRHGFLQQDHGVRNGHTFSTGRGNGRSIMDCE